MKLIFQYMHMSARTSTSSPKRSTFAGTKFSLQNKSVTSFCTHSKYDGTWGSIGMRGYGDYQLFYGVEYDGDLTDGMFHERGTLIYPNNSKIDGFWDNGRMVAHRYFFSDNLCFGPYCEMPDRRYYLELRENIRPACKSLLTNSNETRVIPPGCYDAGDGFYDPKRMCVYDPIDNKKIIRIPTKAQHDWIIKNCRKAWDEPVGYRAKLYENWQDEELDNEFADTRLESFPQNNKIVRKSIDYLVYKRHKSFVDDDDLDNNSDIDSQTENDLAMITGCERS